MSAMGPPPSPEVQAQMRDADHEDHRRLVELLVTCCVLTSFAFIIVCLRFVSRFVLIRNPKFDDYFILGAMILTIGYVADMFIAADHHIGYPASMLTLDDMIIILKVTLSVEVIYYNIIFCIKSSILFTYLRFAVSKTFRTLCIGTIVLHGVFYAICLIATLTQCRPLEKMWDLLGTVEGSCINTTVLFYVTSGFNIITDIWILLLPIKTLHSINRPRREKIALYCVFGAGGFACIASIVRLHTIYRYTLAADPFNDALLVNLWSMIEVTIAISCASVSALKPIFNRAQRQRSREAVSGGKSSKRRHRRFSRRLSSNQNSGITGLTTNTTDLEAAENPFPPTKPLAPLSGSSTLFGNTTTATATSTGKTGDSGDTISSQESSMLFHTPLSPRIKSGVPREAEREPVNSSGSVLLIEKQ